MATRRRQKPSKRGVTRGGNRFAKVTAAVVAALVVNGVLKPDVNRKEVYRVIDDKLSQLEPGPKSETVVDGLTSMLKSMRTSIRGPRWEASPEIQKWNPYLRGDPDAIVDYYEGYSAKDRVKLEKIDKDTGIKERVKVPRRETPMWIAATVWSVNLPKLYESTRQPAYWYYFAERGRKLGMDVPMKDPRLTDKRWDKAEMDIPEIVDNEVLRTQLYHAGLSDLSSGGHGYTGIKGVDHIPFVFNSGYNAPGPTHWGNSEFAKNVPPPPTAATRKSANSKSATRKSSMPGLSH